MAQGTRQQVLEMLEEQEKIYQRLCALDEKMDDLCGAQDPMEYLEGLKEESACQAEETKEDKEKRCSIAEVGRRGEQAAAHYLECMGYEILERNWQCRFGEADIIAKDDGTLVFVEVKTRRGAGAGFPEEAVTAEKRRRYEKIAACYLTDHCDGECRVRFDVLGLLVLDEDKENGHALVKHYVNAFCEA